jgi:hypothetical protein
MKIIALVSVLLLTQTSCVVAGYSNRGGWFFWPGGLLGLLIIVGVLFLLFKRRG